jgi:hypothetical protein
MTSDLITAENRLAKLGIHLPDPPPPFGPYVPAQPRVTCYRVGYPDEPKMAALLVAHHRPGFHFRVVKEREGGRRR